MANHTNKKSLIEHAPAWRDHHRDLLRRHGKAASEMFKDLALKHKTCAIVIAVMVAGDALADDFIRKFAREEPRPGMVVVSALLKSDALTAIGAAVSAESEATILELEHDGPPVGLVVEGGRSSTWVAGTASWS